MSKDDDNPRGYVKSTIKASGTYIDQRVISTNQSGGITAHTVNIGPQDRRISQDQRDAIVDEIKADKGVVTILVESGISDGSVYMGDFIAVFQSGGWEAGYGTRSGNPFSGMIAHPHSHRGARAARAIRNAGIKLDIDLIRAGPPTGGDLTLRIGRAIN